MIVNEKNAVKELNTLEKLNLKIKFKDKESLNALKDILIQTKLFGSNLKKENPEIETKDFEIDGLISELTSAIYKDRISRKKLNEKFTNAVDKLRFHIFKSLSAQISRLRN